MSTKRRNEKVIVPDCFDRAEQSGRVFDNCRFYNDCKNVKPICCDNPVNDKGGIMNTKRGSEWFGGATLQQVRNRIKIVESDLKDCRNKEMTFKFPCLGDPVYVKELNGLLERLEEKLEELENG